MSSPLIGMEKALYIARKLRNEFINSFCSSRLRYSSALGWMRFRRKSCGRQDRPSMLIRHCAVLAGI